MILFMQLQIFKNQNCMDYMALFIIQEAKLSLLLNLVYSCLIFLFCLILKFLIEQDFQDFHLNPLSMNVDCSFMPKKKCLGYCSIHFTWTTLIREYRDDAEQGGIFQTITIQTILNNPSILRNPNLTFISQFPQTALQHS